MKARVDYLWDQVRNSYWFIPSLMALGAIALSVGLGRLDARLALDAERVAELNWIYTGGPEGARAVLSTIAGSMITVAGVVFSITIVALTLASSQFGPRVLSSFMRDTGNQVVLGTFVATFLYCLLVLRAIRSAESAAGVPYASVTVGVALAVASLGVLIYFIHHVSISIQAPQLIASIADELHQNIAELFPEEVGEGSAAPPEPLRFPAEFEREAHPIRARGNGYLDAIDLEVLMEQATEQGFMMRIERRPGSFVGWGDALVRIWPGARVNAKLEEQIRGVFVLGPRRTDIQDVEYTLNQLVEIAVRALSPGINDPFTATTCIDRIGAALSHLARRQMPSPHRVDAEGVLRVAVRRPLTLRGIIDTALNQIRQNAAHHVTVYVRLLETLTEVTETVHGADQVSYLLFHAEAIRRAAMEKVSDPEDRAQIEGRYQALLRSAARQQASPGAPVVEGLREPAGGA